MLFLSLSIEHRFRKFNTKLEDYLEHATRSVTGNIRSEKDLGFDSIKSFNRVYMMLCSSVISFNSAFGFSVLVLVSYVIVDLILNATLLAKLILNNPGYPAVALLVNVMVVARIVWMIFSITNFLKKKLQDHLNTLYEIDEHLKINWRQFSIPFKYFIFQNISTVGSITFNISIWIKRIGIVALHYNIIRYYGYYVITMNGFLMLSLSLSIEHRFRKFNTKLEDYLEHATRSVTGNIRSEKDLGFDSIKSFNRVYMMLCSSVISFNSAFGFSVLVLVSYVIVDLILNATLLAKLILNNPGFPAVALLVNVMVVARIVWMIFSISIPTMLAISCNGAMKAAKDVIGICNKYQNIIPRSSAKENDKIMREELYMLTIMSNCIRPFSAARFFTINQSMLGQIIGSIPPYFIFMLECLQRKKQI
ncbi:hypothetical protein HHI36_011906 [Cryptolaemus montrouzieri]|uniref:Gustatory receptor n=1 Tax=Cryptolaemus montrouzieri TaxID=559131 RepID=A0ABD2NDR3_9CUCU